jgi:hypothetical protein
MSYTAPIKDMLLVMKELAGLEDIATAAGLRRREPRHRAGGARRIGEIVRRSAGAVERRRLSQSE